MPTRETRTSILTFRPEEGFLRVVTKQVEDFELSDAQTADTIAGELVNFTKTPVLVDSRNYTHYKKEVSEYYASKKTAEHITAMAILVSSLSTRIIGNFFIKVHRPHFPTKLFTSDSEAARWLSKFVTPN